MVGVGGVVPFLSSIVTVSFAHFIKNLASYQRWPQLLATSLEERAQLKDLYSRKGQGMSLPDELHLDSDSTKHGAASAPVITRNAVCELRP